MNFSESENVQYLDVIIKFEVYLPYKEPSTYAIFYMCMYILLFINSIARNVLILLHPCADPENVSGPHPPRSAHVLGMIWIT